MADNIDFFEVVKSKNRSCRDKISLENKTQDWTRATGQRGQKSMTDSCIKSRPVSTQRGTPTGWLNASSDQQDQTNIFQGQISFQPPDKSVIFKRGLSGSRLQRNSLVSNSRSGSQSSRRSDISHVTQYVYVTQSPKPPTRLSARFSRELIVNEGDHVFNNYKWNNSDQGLRFQLQMSRLNTCRAIKKSSGPTSHCMDPTYCLFGSRLNLLNRWESDSDKTERKRTYDSRARSQTLRPINQTSIENLPLSVWSVGTDQERELDNSVSSTKYNNTCHITESSDVVSEAESYEADPETRSCQADQGTEVTNVDPGTTSSEISQEAESTDFHEQAEEGDLLSEGECGGEGVRNVQIDYGKIRYREVNQETECHEVNSTEINQETECHEVNSTGINQETECHELNSTGINQETECHELNSTGINQETDSGEGNST